MAGAVCLQGGAEFGPRCREMDSAVLRVAGDGPVVVVALAAAPGLDYRTAAGNGVRYLSSLGATAAAAPDARDDPDGAVASVRDAALVMLPGGSPSRLLEALTGTPVGEALQRASAGGTVVSGSSAGAMVLCEWTVLPEGGPQVVRGLGLVPGTLVLPHYRPDADPHGWLPAVRATVAQGTAVLGLPECSGVLLSDGTRVPLGQAEPTTL